MPKFNVLLLVLLSLYTHVTVNHLNLNYHSFSGPNVCLAPLQMELCRAANIFAAR